MALAVKAKLQVLYQESPEALQNQLLCHVTIRNNDDQKHAYTNVINIEATILNTKCYYYFKAALIYSLHHQQNQEDFIISTV